MLLILSPGSERGVRIVDTPFGPVEVNHSDAHALLQFTEQHRQGCDWHKGTAQSALWRTVAPRPLAAGQPSAVRLACHGAVFGLALVTHRSGGLHEPHHRLVNVDPLALLLAIGEAPDSVVPHAARPQMRPSSTFGDRRPYLSAPPTPTEVTSGLR